MHTLAVIPRLVAHKTICRLGLGFLPSRCRKLELGRGVLHFCRLGTRFQNCHAVEPGDVLSGCRWRVSGG